MAAKRPTFRIRTNRDNGARYVQHERRIVCGQASIEGRPKPLTSGDVNLEREAPAEPHMS